jgi:DNA polymerase-3 subunit epsilon
LTYARLRNRLTRFRLRNTALDTLARNNLKALDHIKPSQPAESYNYVALDLETTGLSLRHDRVVSIGAVRIVDGRIVLGDIFNEIVNPRREIPRASVALHGIVPGRAGGARSAAEVFKDFVAFLGADILVAHHAGFDLHFLNRMMKEKYGFRLQNLTLDTMELCCKVVFKPLRLPTRSDRSHLRCSLDAAANNLGIEIKDRHTAMGDALATAMIFQRILTRIDHGSGSLRKLLRV